MALELVELTKRGPGTGPEDAPRKLGRCKTRKITKRKHRRNLKMRDELKRAGRHRGFSHGKA